MLPVRPPQWKLKNFRKKLHNDFSIDNIFYQYFLSGWFEALLLVMGDAPLETQTQTNPMVRAAEKPQQATSSKQSTNSKT
jgi:hypothetical protein